MIKELAGGIDGTGFSIEVEERGHEEGVVMGARFEDKSVDERGKMKGVVVDAVLEKGEVRRRRRRLEVKRG